MIITKEDFLRRVVKTDSCWWWNGRAEGYDYGFARLSDERRNEGAHRVAYRLWNGEIPDGLFVLHDCNHKRCVNPDHLRVGTKKRLSRGGMWKEKFLRRVRKTDSCWNWDNPGKRGYGYVYVCGKMLRAPRVAYILWVGEIPEGLNILHSCDNPACVNPEHLRVGGQSENIRESFEKGRHTLVKGERNGKSKLTDAAVLNIRKLYDVDGLSLRKIGTLFGVGHTTICNVVRGKTWMHVTDTNTGEADAT